MVKSPLASAGDVRDAGSVPGSGGGHGNPLQPGESPWTEEPGRLYSLWDHKESDTTEDTACMHAGL